LQLEFVCLKLGEAVAWPICWFRKLKEDSLNKSLISSFFTTHGLVWSLLDRWDHDRFINYCFWLEVIISRKILQHENFKPTAAAVLDL
jgi:hypothetical protein